MSLNLLPKSVAKSLPLKHSFPTLFVTKCYPPSASWHLVLFALGHFVLGWPTTFFIVDLPCIHLCHLSSNRDEVLSLNVIGYQHPSSQTLLQVPLTPIYELLILCRLPYSTLYQRLRSPWYSSPSCNYMWYPMGAFLSLYKTFYAEVVLCRESWILKVAPYALLLQLHHLSSVISTTKKVCLSHR